LARRTLSAVAVRGRRHRSPAERDPVRHAEPTDVLHPRPPRSTHQLHSGGGRDHDRSEHADAGHAPVHVRDPPVDGGHGRRPL